MSANCRGCGDWWAISCLLLQSTDDTDSQTYPLSVVPQISEDSLESCLPRPCPSVSDEGIDRARVHAAPGSADDRHRRPSNYRTSLLLPGGLTVPQAP